MVMQTNIPSNLQANIEQIKPAPDKYYSKYYIEAITFNLSNEDNYLWNDMITVLSANFAQVSAPQTECWCKLNTIKLSQKQIRASVKQNGIRSCQKCNKPGVLGRTERQLLEGYGLRTNYVKNTTTLSFCELEQVMATKHPNEKYV